MPTKKSALNITSLLHREVTLLHHNTPIREAATLMEDQNIGCIIAVDDFHDPVGIVSDRDIACSGIAHFRTGEEPLSQVMSPHLIFAEETDSLTHILHLMEQGGVRRIPIIRKTGPHRKTCVGLITLDDLITHHLIQIEPLARIIRSQLHRRTPKTPFQKKASHLRPIPPESPHEKTLNSFYLKISENIEIAPHLLVPVTHFLLSSLAQRLHPTGSHHLASLLPRDLQEELLSLPPGPNRDITIGSIIHQLMTRFHLSEPQARGLLFNFFATLEALFPAQEVSKIKSELPEEFQALLIRTSSNP